MLGKAWSTLKIVPKWRANLMNKNKNKNKYKSKRSIVQMMKETLLKVQSILAVDTYLKRKMFR